MHRLVDILGVQARKMFKQNKVKSMSVDEWNELADYACFCGHGTEILAAHCKSESIVSFEEAQNIAQCMVEGDYFEDFKTQWSHRSPDFKHTDYPWWPKKDQALLKNVDISMLDTKQQEAQYQADLLAISSDVAKVLRWLSQKKDTLKARRLALAAHVRAQIHKGRKEVVEPFMNQTCSLQACESTSGPATGFNAWVRSWASPNGGKDMKVGVADCNKFGRMTNAEVDNLAVNMQKMLSADPDNSCFVVILTTMHTTKNRLQGRAWCEK